MVWWLTDFSTPAAWDQLIPVTNKVEVEGIEEQTRQVLRNLQAILAEKGATLDQVV